MAAGNPAMAWVLVTRSCEWICFVDSDDWVHSRFLERLLYCAKKEGVKVASCGFLKTNCYKPEEMTIKIPVKIPVSDDYIRKDKRIVAYPWGRLYHCSLWENIRFPAGRLWEDVATIYRVLFSVDSVAHLDEELYYYYVNPNGTVNRPWSPNRMDEFLAYEEQLEFFKDKSEYREIYETLQGTYIRAISYSYFKEQNSDLPPDEKRQYAKILRKKIRCALKKYWKSAGITLSNDRHVFDTAYPNLMQVYWLVQSRADKYLKR